MILSETRAFSITERFDDLEIYFTHAIVLSNGIVLVPEITI